MTQESGVALVTGASRGIGLAIVTMLLHRGNRVIASYGHEDDAANEAAARLGDLAGGVVWVKSDLCDINGISPLVSIVEQMRTPLRYVILNVGVTDKTAFGSVTPEKWEYVIRTNLTVPFFLTQSLSMHLENGQGRIVFIGTAMGIWPHAMSYSYGASKAGLHFLAQSLVKVMSPRGITVNVIAPGFVETAMQDGKAPDHRRRIEQKISLRRFAHPEEIAAAVSSVLDLSYVTGQILGVDGGYDLE